MNNKLNFKTSYIRYLRNDEFVTFYKEIAGTYAQVETNIESSYHDNAIANVQARTKDLAMLRAKDRGHYLTFDINELHEERVEAIRMILTERKSRANHTSYEVKAAAARVSFWLRKHVGAFQTATQDSLTARINELFYDMETSVDIINDVDALGWTEHFTGLSALNENYLQARYDRREAEAERVIAQRGAEKVRESLHADLATLLDMTCGIVNAEGIEIADKLMAMLDRSFSRMVSIAKSRANASKNGDAKDGSSDTTDIEADDSNLEEL